MPVGEQVAILYCGTKGLMQAVPVEKVRECQETFLDKMRSTHHAVIDQLASGQIDDTAIEVIERTMADITATYKQE